MYIVYDRIFDDFPAKNTVYTPYIYGSGQPYIHAEDFVPTHWVSPKVSHR